MAPIKAVQTAIRENPSDPWLNQMVPSPETVRSGGEKIAVNHR
jgi:hypothetical protein